MLQSRSYPGSEVQELKKPSTGRASVAFSPLPFRRLVSLGPLIQGKPVTYTIIKPSYKATQYNVNFYGIQTFIILIASVIPRMIL